MGEREGWEGRCAVVARLLMIIRNEHISLIHAM